MLTKDNLDVKKGIFDISNKEYHECEGISRSAICEMKKSPLHYYIKYIKKEKDDSCSAEIAIGSAVHALVLQPEIFDKEFMILEKYDGRTTAGKEYKAKVDKELSGRTAIKKEDHEIAKEIAESIVENRQAAKFLSGEFTVEQSIFWRDEETNLLCKCRPDIWNKDLNLISDIKTTSDASPNEFPYSIKKYGYHIQAAMQIDGILKTTNKKIDYFTFIASPNNKPYKPYIYVLPEEIIEAGRIEYKNALKIIKKCLQKNCWDKERETIINIHLPDFIINNNPFHKLMEIYECQI